MNNDNKSASERESVITKIWVDADACPSATRDILIRASSRTETPLTFIANQIIPVPKLATVNFYQVRQGFDEADKEILRRAEAGDLVVTGDLPLANDLLTNNVAVLSPRGERFTVDNIKARLNMRDFMETMRASGVQSGGPRAHNASDNKLFAQKLDAWLAKRSKLTAKGNATDG